jgi:Lrp/AsnC family leucine-responsive transcriptional regulator
MLNDIDKKILNALQQNARLTNRELAEKLNLSTTPVFERIKKLEKKGIIRSYVALLDAKKVNKNLVAITQVKLDIHSKKLIEAFNKKIITFDEVMECYHTTGDADFILKIMVSDLEDYYRFIMDKLTQTTDVAHISTSFVLNEIKYTTAIQL